MKKRHYYYLLFLVMLLFSLGHYLACDLSAKAVNEPYIVSGERHASGYIENMVTDKVKI